MNTGTWSLIASILTLAAVYVFLPVVSSVYARFRWRTSLRCPDTGEMTHVRIDAPHAACTSLFGAPELRVRNCAEWPERMECDQDCLKEVATG